MAFWHGPSWAGTSHHSIAEKEHLKCNSQRHRSMKNLYFDSIQSWKISRLPNFCKCEQAVVIQKKKFPLSNVPMLNGTCKSEMQTWKNPPLSQMFGQLNTLWIDDEVLITRPNALLVYSPYPFYFRTGILSSLKYSLSWYASSTCPQPSLIIPNSVHLHSSVTLMHTA